MEKSGRKMSNLEKEHQEFSKNRTPAAFQGKNRKKPRSERKFIGQGMGMIFYSHNTIEIIHCSLGIRSERIR